MTTIKIVRLCLLGALVGATLAVIDPPRLATADGAAGFCRCTDDGEGTYKCNGHTACRASTEFCIVTCIDR